MGGAALHVVLRHEVGGQGQLLHRDRLLVRVGHLGGLGVHLGQLFRAAGGRRQRRGVRRRRSDLRPRRRQRQPDAERGEDEGGPEHDLSP